MLTGTTPWSGPRGTDCDILREGRGYGTLGRIKMEGTVMNVDMKRNRPFQEETRKQQSAMRRALRPKEVDEVE